MCVRVSVCVVVDKQGIEVPPVKCLVFNRMSDHMFEATNWQRFKTFVRKVRVQSNPFRTAAMNGFWGRRAQHSMGTMLTQARILTCFWWCWCCMVCAHRYGPVQSVSLRTCVWHQKTQTKV